MLISAAVCPHPPILLPEVAGEAAAELDGLRAACDAAIRALDGDVVVVVGGGERTCAYDGPVAASLRPYGLDAVHGDPQGEALPLSLTIGHRLLARSAKDVPVRYQEVAFDASPVECAELGAKLAEVADRVAFLVMGDGSACRTEKAPGYLDERAAPYDAAVARALADADGPALAALDPVLSDGVRAAGRAAWQVLAGAAGEAAFDADLLADEAPYGVGYFAARWRR
ncbi:hypothetical protein [Actinomadura parmotrematis]|uniref:Uncharacterized protein n=1 Tax=Actinomadura parmotrematis TaxID=2864039 RepID=A0ABS7FTG2_9ACTN|nr:hypothetical protein [Actinomadura parmotrematis]MBW8483581.1 hypothetical protein [Actinomadura parmotrematis]